MDIKLASGRIANHRARYRTLDSAHRHLVNRGIAEADMEFLSIAGEAYVYWYQAR